jgi:hypothetical protein
MGYLSPPRNRSTSQDESAPIGWLEPPQATLPYYFGPNAFALARAYSWSPPGRGYFRSEREPSSCGEPTNISLDSAAWPLEVVVESQHLS